jgi:uncharacterized protein YecE (DUF72 family)
VSTRKESESKTLEGSKWRIGTSGWIYPHWKGVFYPPGVPQSKWLGFYARQLDTVEVNATFYRLPKPSTFAQWYEKTPVDFLWAVKGNKFITHTRRLRDPDEPLRRLYSAVEGLKGKLGPILFQLPPNLSFDHDLFKEFCEHLAPFHLHVLEIRHGSWINDDLFHLLTEHNIAFCISDTAGRYPYYEVITANFVYVRLHGSKRLYGSEYTERELAAWARKLMEWGKNTYLYFDNDFQGYAVRNAIRLKEILRTP